MGLKDLKSTLDLVGGEGIINNMQDQSGPQFQLPTDAASQVHIDSLEEVPTTSPFQDINGVPDPNFNTLNGTVNSPFQSATGDHMVDLLTKNAVSTNTGQTYVPSPSKSPFQDINGVQGPQSQLPIVDASQKHIDSLSQVPGGNSNSPFQDRLDGATPTGYTNPDTGASF